MLKVKGLEARTNHGAGHSISGLEGMKGQLVSISCAGINITLQVSPLNETNPLGRTYHLPCSFRPIEYALYEWPDTEIH